MNDWSEEAFAAYVAAMIDGEGHIEIISDYAVRVRIANTIKPTLEAIIQRLGFGRVIEYARPPGKGYKRLYCAEISSARTVGKLFDICGRFIHMKPEQMTRAMAVVNRVLADGDALDLRNRAILAAIRTGSEKQIDIARRFGVSPQLISRLKRGHQWSSVITAHRARALLKDFPRKQCQEFRLHGAPL